MSYMKQVIKNHLRATGQKKIGRMKRLQPPIALERKYLRQMLPILNKLHELVKTRLVPRLEAWTEAQYDKRSPIEKRKRMDAPADNVIEVVKGLGLQIDDEFDDAELTRIATEMGIEVSNQNLADLKSSIRQLVNIDLFLPDEALAHELAAFTVGNVQLIQNLSEDVLDKVQGSILEGFRTGARWETIADDILDITDPEDGIGRSRAEFIARDQVNKLNGQLAQLRQTDLGIEKYIWRTVLDERVRPSHAAHEGKTFSWDDPPEPTGAPGDDYNCVISGTYVSFTDRILRAYRRQYVGEVINLRTHSGSFSVTPNHPVLTLRGWVYAKDLEQGDELFECLNTEQGSRGADVNHGHPTADQVFDLLSIRSRFERVAGRDVQFHGDGSDHEVDVVTVDGGLGANAKSKLDEPFAKFTLPSADSATSNFDCLRAQLPFGVADNAIECRSVSFSELVSPGGRIHTRPLDLLCFRLPANTSGHQKMSAYDEPINTEGFSDSVLTLARLVSNPDSGCVEVYGVVGSLSLLKVVPLLKVTRHEYSGFVYNFETYNGAFCVSSQNCWTGNCRCWAEPILDDLLAEAQDEGTGDDGIEDD